MLSMSLGFIRRRTSKREDDDGSPVSTSPSTPPASSSSPSLLRNSRTRHVFLFSSFSSLSCLFDRQSSPNTMNNSARTSSKGTGLFRRSSKANAETVVLPTTTAVPATTAVSWRALDWSQGHWKKLYVVGRGAKGKVYKVRHDAGEAVAVCKVAEDGGHHGVDDGELLRTLLRMPLCANCIQLYHMSTAPPFLILEYADGGSLADLWASIPGGSLKETDIQQATRQVLVGLSLLHDHSIVHHDLKPANILVSGQNPVTLKISDFGESFLATEQRRRDVVGTPLYAAPECVVHQEGGSCDCCADVWALGILVLFLAEQVTPRARETGGFHGLAMLIRNGDPPTLQQPRSWSAGLNEFAAACLVKLPSNRASCKSLSNMAWIEDASPSFSETVLNLVSDRVRRTRFAEEGKIADYAEALASTSRTLEHELLL